MATSRPRRSVRSPQLGTRIMYFKVTGTGTAAINQGSEDATLSDNNTGDYTLTWTEPFQQAPIVIAFTGTDVTTAWVKTAPTTTAVTIETVGADQTTPTDAIFYVIVIGSDHPYEN